MSLITITKANIQKLYIYFRLFCTFLVLRNIFEMCTLLFALPSLLLHLLLLQRHREREQGCSLLLHGQFLLHEFKERHVTLWISLSSVSWNMKVIYHVMRITYMSELHMFCWVLFCFLCSFIKHLLQKISNINNK